MGGLATLRDLKFCWLLGVLFKKQKKLNELKYLLFSFVSMVTIYCLSDFGNRLA